MDFPEQDAPVASVCANDLLHVRLELIEVVRVDIPRLGRLCPAAVVVTGNWLGRLVQEDQLRGAVDGGGEVQPPLLPAGELARQAVDGPPVAVLSIDHLGIEVPVYDGTSEDVLKRGVGRIEGTARVDHEGNLGIAGHRDSFFRPLKDIEIGDMMELQTGDGIVTYAVSSIEIVEPEDVFVLAPTSEPTLT